MRKRLKKPRARRKRLLQIAGNRKAVEVKDFFQLACGADVIADNCAGIINHSPTSPVTQKFDV